MTASLAHAGYDTLPRTLDYRAHLARAFGIAWARSPAETWMPWRGHDVHVDDWEPQGAARGTVILVHGAGGNGRLLAPFALPALDAGFAVRAPDLPGYGLTRARAGGAIEYAEWVDLVADLADEAAGRGPVVVFGLSVGGMTAFWAAQKARAVAGVIATTLLDLRDPGTFVRAARPWAGSLSLLAFRAFPKVADAVSLPLVATTPIESLTTDAVLARTLCGDPLIGRRWVRAGLFRSMTTYRPPRGDFSLGCPFLLVHPGADEWTPLGASLPVYERIRAAETELVVLTNGAACAAGDAGVWGVGGGGGEVFGEVEQVT